MKKITFIALLIMVFSMGFSSCSKDDSSPENPTVSLIGTWHCVDYETTYIGPEEIDFPYFIVQSEYCYFCENNSTDNYGEKYKYTYNEKNQTINVNQVNNNGSIDDETETWSVLKLTSNELWLKINEVGNQYDLYKMQKVN